MKYMADLHTHSTASDGQFPPTQLVTLAQKAGVTCLAITDHDTLDGVAEGLAAGRGLGLTVLPGVELGAKEHKNLHIVGLNYQLGPSPLSQLCQTLKEGRDQRKYRIIDFLAEKGVPVTLEEVEAVAGGEISARPHFAQVMVQRGYVANTREAFDRYLDTSEYKRIERFKAPAQDCIAAIHAAGGKAVMAHPYQLGCPDDQLEATIAQLKDFGLDALECYYPKHTPQQVKQYLALAKSYDLFVSGGSDFHGPKVHPETVIAPVELELDWLF